MGISVHTLRNWEQGRRRPEGPAIGLLRIAARHPRILRGNLESAARQQLAQTSLFENEPANRWLRKQLRSTFER
jgi:hypothetical protein